MRRLLANWVAKDYTKRVFNALRVFPALAVLCMTVLAYLLGHFTGYLANHNLPPIWFFYAAGFTILFEFYVISVLRPNNVKVLPALTTIPVENIEAVVQQFYVERIEPEGVWDGDAPAIVEWCNKQIGKSLRFAIQHRHVLPLRTTAVMFVERSVMNNMYSATNGYPDPDMNGFYDVALDIAVVCSTTKSKCSELRYECLYQMLHRYTQDEAKRVYLTAAVAYMSDDQECFIKAFDKLKNCPESVKYWPSFLPKAGWLS